MILFIKSARTPIDSPRAKPNIMIAESICMAIPQQKDTHQGTADQEGSEKVHVGHISSSRLNRIYQDDLLGFL